MGADNPQPSEKSSLPVTKGGSEKYVFGILALIIAATAGYQIFFCPNCYASSDRTAVQQQDAK